MARLVDATTGAQLWSPPLRSRLAAARISPDGALAAIVSHSEGLAVYDLASGRLLWRLPTGDFQDKVMAFSRDGKLLVRQEQDGVPTIRDATDGRVIRRLGKVESQFGISVSPDGRYVAADHGGQSVIEMATGKIVREIPYRASLLAFLPGGIVAAGDSGQAAIRLSRIEDDVETGRIVIPRSLGTPMSMAASGDGSRLLVGTSRGVVLVFSVQPPS